MSDWNASYRGQGELLASPQMQAAMKQIAEHVAQRARDTSPVGTSAGDDTPGEYRDGWRVESGVRETPSRRAYGEIVNDVSHSASVEYGNGRTKPPHRAQKTIDAHYVLTRALDAIREL